MNKFKIAHIREQGVDLVIVPLDSSFGRKTQEAQNEAIDSLQACASNAGLAGTVVPVWQDGSRTRFIAPPSWHPFFKGLSWHAIHANINKELTCG